MDHPIPVLRSLDETKTREFYQDFLGFKVDWEHRFAAGMPLYMQVSRGNCLLHLSEHQGDCAPGARVRIEVPDLDAYLEHLRASQSGLCRSDQLGQVEPQPWGLREVSLSDPSGNWLTLYAPSVLPN